MQIQINYIAISNCYGTANTARFIILRLNTQQIISSAILPQNMVDWIRSRISPPAAYRSIRKIFAKKSLWPTDRNCSRDVGNCINKKGKELSKRESHGRLNTHRLNTRWLNTTSKEYRTHKKGEDAEEIANEKPRLSTELQSQPWSM